MGVGVKRVHTQRGHDRYGAASILNSKPKPNPDLDRVQINSRVPRYAAIPIGGGVVETAFSHSLRADFVRVVLCGPAEAGKENAATGGEKKLPYIDMDAMAFGMGCCCLQVRSKAGRE